MPGAGSGVEAVRGIYRVENVWVFRCAYCRAVLRHDNPAGLLVKIAMHLAWHYARDPLARAAVEQGAEQLNRALAGRAVTAAALGGTVGVIRPGVVHVEMRVAAAVETGPAAVVLERPGMTVEVRPA
jgi:hypothetical protein